VEGKEGKDIEILMINQQVEASNFNPKTILRALRKLNRCCLHALAISRVEGGSNGMFH